MTADLATGSGIGAWIRPLGSTGLSVSAVTIGGAPLGSMPVNFGYEVSRDDGIALARHVLDSPIRVLDTANSYAGGESERRIGAAIAQRGGLPDDFLITTKVDRRDGDYSGARVRASLAESKARLGLDELPLVYLHDPEFCDFDELSAPGGAVETLVELKNEGEIGHIGLAGGDVREMRKYFDLGVFEVLLVHNRWTLVDRSAADLIARATEAGTAVVNAAIYGGGLLANPDAADDTARYGYRPAPPETISAVRSMAQVCRDRGTDLATAALHASVRDPLISSTLVGTSRPERVDRTVAALSADLPDALFDQLADLTPAPEHWLDHQS